MSYVMNTLDRGKAASGAGLISAGPEATARNGVVMSVFPTPTSNISDFARYRMRYYDRTLVALRQAHDHKADVPTVLALVNELTCLAEEILVIAVTKMAIHAEPAARPPTDFLTG